MSLGAGWMSVSVQVCTTLLCFILVTVTGRAIPRSDWDTGCTQVNYNVSSVAELKRALLATYDRTRVPAPGHVTAFTLLEISDLWSIDTKSGSFWMASETSTYWLDCRLAYEDQGSEELKYVVWEVSQIWQPNYQDFRTRDSIPYRKKPTIFSMPNGFVYETVPWVGRYGCSMDLTKIPYDTQTCSRQLKASTPSDFLTLWTWCVCVCVCPPHPLVPSDRVPAVLQKGAQPHALPHLLLLSYGLTRFVSDQCSALSVCLFVSLQSCVCLCPSGPMHV